MTNEELDARLNELEEHANARADLTLAAATELVAAIRGGSDP